MNDTCTICGDSGGNLGKALMCNCGDKICHESCVDKNTTHIDSSEIIQCNKCKNPQHKYEFMMLSFNYIPRVRKFITIFGLFQIFLLISLTILANNIVNNNYEKQFNIFSFLINIIYTVFLFSGLYIEENPDNPFTLRVKNAVIHNTFPELLSKFFLLDFCPLLNIITNAIFLIFTNTEFYLTAQGIAMLFVPISIILYIIVNLVFMCIGKINKRDYKLIPEDNDELL